MATAPAPVGATNPGSIPGTPTPADGDSGSVSAPYAKGSAAQYVLISASGQIYGNLTTYTQAIDGAVTAMDENTLTGQTVVKDINGDASFALGRWYQGTATTKNGSAVLTGTAGTAYHYALFNRFAALPTSGVYNCDAGKFTSPTNAAGGSSLLFGVANGSAKLSFSAAGAAVDVTINATAGSQTGTATWKSVLATPTTMMFGPSLLLMMGDGGGGKALVVAYFDTTMPNAVQYEGVAVFRCSP